MLGRVSASCGRHTHRQEELITIRTLKVEKFKLKLERPSSWRGNVIYNSFPQNHFQTLCTVSFSHHHCSPALHSAVMFVGTYIVQLICCCIRLSVAALSQWVSAIRVTLKQLQLLVGWCDWQVNNTGCRVDYSCLHLTLHIIHDTVQWMYQVYNSNSKAFELKVKWITLINFLFHEVELLLWLKDFV